MLGPDDLLDEFCQTSKEEVILILYKALQSLEEDEYFSTHFMRPALP